MSQLLISLPIGAKIKFGRYSVNGEIAEPIKWQLLYANSRGPILITEMIIDIRNFDSAEPDNPIDECKTFGCNYYGLSNIDQWLNKDYVNWYEPSHSFDQAPEDASVMFFQNTPYVDRPGFLNEFSETEKALLVERDVECIMPGDNDCITEQWPRMVFLPSLSELGSQRADYLVEGNAFIGLDLIDLICKVPKQVTDNSNLHPAVNSNRAYILRTPEESNLHKVWTVNANGDFALNYASTGDMGIRPCVFISENTLVSDTTDEDGYYTIAGNKPPTSPTNIHLPSKVLRGDTFDMSWDASTDPEGDDVHYQVWVKDFDNDTIINTITDISTNSCNITIPADTTVNAIKVVIAAYDNYQNRSEKVESDKMPIIAANKPPTITTNLSPLFDVTDRAGFSFNITVADEDLDPLEITVAIHSDEIYHQTALKSGTKVTIDITGETWARLGNGGPFPLYVTVSDGVSETKKTFWFNKKVNSLSVMNKAPLSSTDRPIRISVDVDKDIPSVALFKVEVCNNGFDETPTWEDCTSAVNSKLAYVFNNTTKSADKWGIRIRVTVERNGGVGACYIKSIGGNYE